MRFTERRRDERNDRLAGWIGSTRIFSRNSASRLIVWGQFAGRSSELGILLHLLRTVLNCAFRATCQASIFSRTKLNSPIYRLWRRESSFRAKFKYPRRSVSQSSHSDSHCEDLKPVPIEPRTEETRNLFSGWQSEFQVCLRCGSTLLWWIKKKKKVATLEPRMEHNKFSLKENLIWVFLLLLIFVQKHPVIKKYNSEIITKTNI